MKKQNLRSMLLFLSLLLFPLTQWYFSPFLIIVSAMQGIVNGSLLVFLFLILVGFFFGRGPCGWVMPCGGFQECMFSVNDHKQKNQKLFNIKYIIWAIWLLAIILSVLHAKGYHQVDPFFAMPNKISIDEPFKYIIYYLIVVIFFVMSLLFGKRASCHYICWMAPFMVLGRKLRNLIHAPALQLSAKQSDCINCKLCEKACPMSLPVHEMVQTNHMEQPECILCGKCESACPKQVIHFEFNKPSSAK